MISSDRRAVRNAILMCVFALFGAAASVGAMDDERLRAESERIRREMDASQERVIRAYVAEQPEGRARADINLIIGTLYEVGQFGEADPVRAVGYYEDAAAMGSGNAMCALGILYDTGARTPSGVIERDVRRSREYLERAVEAGSVRALVELGVIYADGKNVDPDSKVALEYFVRAAEHGDPDALDRLEPVMRKAREWEDARPERKGKSGFPTSKEEVIVKERIDRYIDETFNLQKQMSATLVELNKRFRAAARRQR